MIKKGIIAVMLGISTLLLLIIIASNSQSEGSGTYPYSGNGDWIIENETNVRNESFLLNGSLIIKNNGILELYNVSIEVNSSENYDLIVEENGKFYLSNSNIMPSDSSNPYNISIFGEMTIEDSFVGGLLDNMPPETPIIEEINPRSITSKGTIEIKGTATDNKGVKSIEVFITQLIDNKEIKEKVKTIQFNQFLKTRAFEVEIRLKIGLNLISVRAIDSFNAGMESEKQEVIMIGMGTYENITIEKSSIQLKFKTLPKNYDWLVIKKNINLALPKNVIFHDVSWLIDSNSIFNADIKAEYEPTHLYGINEEDLMIIMSSSSNGWKVIPSTLLKDEHCLSFYSHFVNYPTYLAVVSGIVDLGIKKIELSNDAVLKGHALKIKAIIENTGKFTKDIDEGKTIKIEFVAVDINSDKSYPIKTVELEGKFESNKELEVEVVWDEIEKGGIYKIYVIVDAYPEIVEYNLDNNEKSMDIEVIDIGEENSKNEKKEEMITVPTKIIAISTIAGLGIIIVWIKRYGILIPLYSRIKKSEVLNNKLRERIHNRILANPGENLGTIKNALKLNNGAVIHHLTRLEKEGFIKSQREGMYRRFYPNGTKLPEYIEIQDLIRKNIQQKEGITQSDIALKLGASRQLINYHIKTMVEKGVVRLEKNGRETKCFLASN